MVFFPFLFTFCTLLLALGIIWYLLYSSIVIAKFASFLLQWKFGPDQEIKIGSLDFALLGGEIFIHDFEYRTNNAILLIMEMTISFNYWSRIVRGRDPTPDLKNVLPDNEIELETGLPYRLSIRMIGVEYIIHSNSYKLDELADLIIQQQQQQNTINISIPAASTHSEKEEKTGDEDTIGIGVSSDSNLIIPWIYRVLPQIRVTFEDAAIMFGTRQLPYFAVVYVTQGSMIHTTEDAPSKLDICRVLTNINMSVSRVFLQDNSESYSGDQEILEMQRHLHLHDEDFFSLAMAGFKNFFTKDDIVKDKYSYVDSLKREGGHKRNSSALGGTTGVGSVASPSTQVEDHFFRRHHLLLKTGYIHVEYYYDLPGICPSQLPSLQKTKEKQDTAVDSNQQIYPAPEYGVRVEFSDPDTVLNYGPFADFQRGLIQYFFYPYFYRDQPILSLSPGDTREYLFFTANLYFAEGALIHMPYESKTDGDKGVITTNNSWDFNIKSRSRVDVLIPWYATSAEGCDMIIETNLRGASITPSIQNKPQFSEMPHIVASLVVLRCKVHYPIQWNAIQKWDIDVRFVSPVVYLLREHIQFWTDLIAQWSKFAAINYPSLACFVPGIYTYNIVFSDNPVIIFNVNENNIIDTHFESTLCLHPTGTNLVVETNEGGNGEPQEQQQNPNALIKWTMSDMSITMQQPALDYYAQSSNISFQVQAERGNMNLTFPDHHPMKELLRSSFANFFLLFQTLRVTGSYLYHHQIHPDNVDTMEIILRVVELDLKLFGQVYRYLLSWIDNYMGSNTSVISSEEYVNSGYRNNISKELLKRRYETVIENAFEVMFHVIGEGFTLRLPRYLFGGSGMSLRDLTARCSDFYMDFRNLAEYNDMSLSFSPLTVTIPVTDKSEIECISQNFKDDQAATRGAGATFGESTVTELTYLQLSEISLQMHNSFGLKPDCYLYRSAVVLYAAEISGQILPSQLYSLVTSFSNIMQQYNDSVDYLNPSDTPHTDTFRVMTEEEKVQSLADVNYECCLGYCCVNLLLSSDFGATKFFLPRGLQVCSSSQITSDGHLKTIIDVPMCNIIHLFPDLNSITDKSDVSSIYGGNEKKYEKQETKNTSQMEWLSAGDLSCGFSCTFSEQRDDWVQAMSQQSEFIYSQIRHISEQPDDDILLSMEEESRSGGWHQANAERVSLSEAFPMLDADEIMARKLPPPFNDLIFATVQPHNKTRRSVVSSSATTFATRLDDNKLNMSTLLPSLLSPTSSIEKDLPQSLPFSSESSSSHSPSPSFPSLAFSSDSIVDSDSGSRLSFHSVDEIPSEEGGFDDEGVAHGSQQERAYDGIYYLPTCDPNTGFHSAIPTPLASLLIHWNIDFTDSRFLSNPTTSGTSQSVFAPLPLLVFRPLYLDPASASASSLSYHLQRSTSARWSQSENWKGFMKKEVMYMGSAAQVLNEVRDSSSYHSSSPDTVHSDRGSSPMQQQYQQKPLLTKKARIDVLKSVDIAFCSSLFSVLEEYLQLMEPAHSTMEDTLDQLHGMACSYDTSGGILPSYVSQSQVSAAISSVNLTLIQSDGMPSTLSTNEEVVVYETRMHFGELTFNSVVDFRKNPMHLKAQTSIVPSSSYIMPFLTISDSIHRVLRVDGCSLDVSLLHPESFPPKFPFVPMSRILAPHFQVEAETEDQIPHTSLLTMGIGPSKVEVLNTHTLTTETIMDNLHTKHSSPQKSKLRISIGSIAFLSSYILPCVISALSLWNVAIDELFSVMESVRRTRHSRVNALVKEGLLFGLQSHHFESISRLTQELLVNFLRWRLAHRGEEQGPGYAFKSDDSGIGITSFLEEGSNDFGFGQLDQHDPDNYTLSKSCPFSIVLRALVLFLPTIQMRRLIRELFRPAKEQLASETGDNNLDLALHHAAFHEIRSRRQLLRPQQNHQATLIPSKQAEKTADIPSRRGWRGPKTTPRKEKEAKAEAVAAQEKENILEQKEEIFRLCLYEIQQETNLLLLADDGKHVSNSAPSIFSYEIECTTGDIHLALLSSEDPFSQLCDHTLTARGLSGNASFIFSPSSVVTEASKKLFVSLSCEAIEFEAAPDILDFFNIISLIKLQNSKLMSTKRFASNKLLNAKVESQSTHTFSTSLKQEADDMKNVTTSKSVSPLSKSNTSSVGFIDFHLESGISSISCTARVPRRGCVEVSFDDIRSSYDSPNLLCPCASAVSTTANDSYIPSSVRQSFFFSAQSIETVLLVFPCISKRPADITATTSAIPTPLPTPICTTSTLGGTTGNVDNTLPHSPFPNKTLSAGEIATSLVDVELDVVIKCSIKEFTLNQLLAMPRVMRDKEKLDDGRKESVVQFSDDCRCRVLLFAFSSENSLELFSQLFTGNIELYDFVVPWFRPSLVLDDFAETSLSRKKSLQEQNSDAFSKSKVASFDLFPGFVRENTNSVNYDTSKCKNQSIVDSVSTSNYRLSASFSFENISAKILPHPVFTLSYFLDHFGGFVDQPFHSQTICRASLGEKEHKLVYDIHSLFHPSKTSSSPTTSVHDQHQRQSVSISPEEAKKQQQQPIYHQYDIAIIHIILNSSEKKLTVSDDGISQGKGKIRRNVATPASELLTRSHTFINSTIAIGPMKNVMNADFLNQFLNMIIPMSEQFNSIASGLSKFFEQRQAVTVGSKIPSSSSRSHKQPSRKDLDQTNISTPKRQQYNRYSLFDEISDLTGEKSVDKSRNVFVKTPISYFVRPNSTTRVILLPMTSSQQRGNSNTSSQQGGVSTLYHLGINLVFAGLELGATTFPHSHPVLVEARLRIGSFRSTMNLEPDIPSSSNFHLLIGSVELPELHLALLTPQFKKDLEVFAEDSSLNVNFSIPLGTRVTTIGRVNATAGETTKDISSAASIVSMMPQASTRHGTSSAIPNLPATTTAMPPMTATARDMSAASTAVVHIVFLETRIYIHPLFLPFINHLYFHYSNSYNIFVQQRANLNFDLAGAMRSWYQGKEAIQDQQQPEHTSGLDSLVSLFQGLPDFSIKITFQDSSIDAFVHQLMLEQTREDAHGINNDIPVNSRMSTSMSALDLDDLSKFMIQTSSLYSNSNLSQAYWLLFLLDTFELSFHYSPPKEVDSGTEHHSLDVGFQLHNLSFAFFQQQHWQQHQHTQTPLWLPLPSFRPSLSVANRLELGWVNGIASTVWNDIDPLSLSSSSTGEAQVKLTTSELVIVTDSSITSQLLTTIDVLSSVNSPGQHFHPPTQYDQQQPEASDDGSNSSRTSSVSNIQLQQRQQQPQIDVICRDWTIRYSLTTQGGNLLLLFRRMATKIEKEHNREEEVIEDGMDENARLVYSLSHSSMNTEARNEDINEDGHDRVEGDYHHQQHALELPVIRCQYTFHALALMNEHLSLPPHDFSLQIDIPPLQFYPEMLTFICEMQRTYLQFYQLSGFVPVSGTCANNRKVGSATYAVANELDHPRQQWFNHPVSIIGVFSFSTISLLSLDSNIVLETRFPKPIDICWTSSSSSISSITCSTLNIPSIQFSLRDMTQVVSSRVFVVELKSLGMHLGAQTTTYCNRSTNGSASSSTLARSHQSLLIHLSELSSTLYFSKLDSIYTMKEAWLVLAEQELGKIRLLKKLATDSFEDEDNIFTFSEEVEDLGLEREDREHGRDRNTDVVTDIEKEIQQYDGEDESQERNITTEKDLFDESIGTVVTFDLDSMNFLIDLTDTDPVNSVISYRSRLIARLHTPPDSDVRSLSMSLHLHDLSVNATPKLKWGGIEGHLSSSSMSCVLLKGRETNLEDSMKQMQYSDWNDQKRRVPVLLVVRVLSPSVEIHTSQIPRLLEIKSPLNPHMSATLPLSLAEGRGISFILTDYPTSFEIFIDFGHNLSFSMCSRTIPFLNQTIDHLTTSEATEITTTQQKQQQQQSISDIVPVVASRLLPRPCHLEISGIRLECSLFGDSLDEQYITLEVVHYAIGVNTQYLFSSTSEHILQRNLSINFGRMEEFHNEFKSPWISSKERWIPCYPNERLDRGVSLRIVTRPSFDTRKRKKTSSFLSTNDTDDVGELPFEEEICFIQGNTLQMILKNQIQMLALGSKQHLPIIVSSSQLSPLQLNGDFTTTWDTVRVSTNMSLYRDLATFSRIWSSKDTNTTTSKTMDSSSSSSSNTIFNFDVFTFDPPINDIYSVFHWLGINSRSRDVIPQATYYNLLIPLQTLLEGLNKVSLVLQPSKEKKLNHLRIQNDEKEDEMMD